MGIVLGLGGACGDSSSEVAPTSSEGGAGEGGSLDPTDGGASSDASAPPPVCPASNTGPGTAPLGTLPGALTTPFPTIRNLTVEWAITGDENLNGVVELRYRQAGGTIWKKGLPLRRVPAGAVEGFSWENRHAGSVFDLEADTTYEVEAFLLDPDGGCEVRAATVKTRPVPAPMAGAPIKPVTPATFAAASASAEPGDVLELGAGTYAPFSFPNDGAPGKPIVIRAAAGATATVTGDISLITRKYVHLVGLTVQGRVRINATTEVAVIGNTVNATGDGIVAGLRSENDYIANNVVTGATTWAESSLGVDGNNVGEGIAVIGPGHVIEHNRVRGFRDCISFFEDGEAKDQLSIDVVENDVDTCADDGIEADFCFHDCRIVRNRITNTFIAMSSQPGLGGPTYFVRNVAYNTILSAFKLQRGSVGDVLLHNTIVKGGDAFGIYTTDVFSRQYARNNLFIGGPGGTFNGYSSGSGRVMSLDAADPSGDYDFDGFGSTTGTFTGRLGATSFASLAELRATTSEEHAVAVGLDVFAAAVTIPSNPFPARPVGDLALAAGGAAVDVGVVLPNVNDGHAGAGPDLGAYEVGQPPVVYGPR